MYSISFQFQVERTLRIKGDLHVGALMIKLVDDLGEKFFKKYFKKFNFSMLAYNGKVLGAKP